MILYNENGWLPFRFDMERETLQDFCLQMHSALVWEHVHFGTRIIAVSEGVWKAHWMRPWILGESISSLVHREKSVIKPKQNIRSSNIGRKFYRFIEMWIEEYNFDFLVFIFVQLFVCLFWCVNSIGDWVWANQVTYIIRIVFFEHSQKCCIVTATIVIHFRGLLLETLDYH